MVTCVTPGAEPVVAAADLRPGVHLNMLGADGPGKAEAEVEAGLVARDRVTELGAVLTGEAPGRSDPEATTMFDSTGLAIQDLAICLAVLEAHRAGQVKAGAARL